MQLLTGEGHILFIWAFGTACCGIEFMAVAAARYDVSRFGAEVVRFSQDKQIY